MRKGEILKELYALTKRRIRIETSDIINEDGSTLKYYYIWSYDPSNMGTGRTLEAAYDMFLKNYAKEKIQANQFSLGLL